MTQKDAQTLCQLFVSYLIKQLPGENHQTDHPQGTEEGNTYNR